MFQFRVFDGMQHCPCVGMYTARLGSFLCKPAALLESPWHSKLSLLAWSDSEMMVRLDSCRLFRSTRERWSQVKEPHLCSQGISGCMQMAPLASISMISCKTLSELPQPSFCFCPQCGVFCFSARFHDWPGSADLLATSLVRTQQCQ